MRTVGMDPHADRVAASIASVQQNLSHVARVREPAVAAKVVAVAIPRMVDSGQEHGLPIPHELGPADSQAKRSLGSYGKW